MGKLRKGAPPIPMVRGFCLFAAIVVVLDFVFCITFFASATVVYEKYLRKAEEARDGA